MKHDVIPPLSDCVQLSVEQYRTKLYDIIRAEKGARRRQDEKVGERRASSHELREKNREVRSGSLGDNREAVRKVHSEVNVRGQSPGQSQSPAEKGTIKGHLLPGRRLATAGARTNYEEQKQSLKETIKQSMTTGYCYRPTLLKNKS